MFYCEKCGRGKKWPTDFFLPQSYGLCEICKEKAICFDVPSSHLPYQVNTLTPSEKAWSLLSEMNGRVVTRKDWEYLTRHAQKTLKRRSMIVVDAVLSSLNTSAKYDYWQQIGKEIESL
jgi:hypothetical protein